MKLSTMSGADAEVEPVAEAVPAAANTEGMVEVPVGGVGKRQGPKAEAVMATGTGRVTEGGRGKDL